MDNKNLKDDFGLNGVLLAKLTGQTSCSISEKLNENKERGYSLGGREAGILACWSVMTDEQKESALNKTDDLLNIFSSKAYDLI